MQRQMRVIQGTASEARPRSGIESAYDHFRLERQGGLVSQSALEHYDYIVQPFLIRRLNTWDSHERQHLSRQGVNERW